MVIMGNRVARTTIEFIALWFACVSVCGQSAPTKNIFASVHELADKCSDNPFLGKEYAADVNFCNGTLKAKIRLQCLSFLDINRRLCALKESAGFNLSDRIRAEALKTPLNIETMCAKTEAFTFGSLPDYPEYAVNIQKYLGNQTPCIKLCASDDFTVDEPNFFCRAFYWGLDVLKDVSSAIEQAGAESSTTLQLKTAKDGSPTTHEATGQATGPKGEAIKDGDVAQVAASEKIIGSNVISGHNLNVESSSLVAGSSPDQSASKINNVGARPNQDNAESKPPEIPSPVATLQSEPKDLNQGNPPAVGAHQVNAEAKTSETSEVRPPLSSDAQATLNNVIQPEAAAESDPVVHPLETNAQLPPKHVKSPASQSSQGAIQEPLNKVENAGAGELDDYDSQGTGEDSPPLDDNNLEDPEHAVQEIQVPQMNRETNSKVFNSGPPDDYLDSDGGQFFPVFFTGVVLMVLLYILYHNKNKVMGLLIEGRQPGGRRRNSRGHAYRRLDTLEQAISSNAPGATPSKIIY